jgi:hypothetical protein
MVMIADKILLIIFSPYSLKTASALEENGVAPIDATQC